MTDRQALRALAKQAGYGRDELSLVASAVIPRFEKGTQLTDAQVAQVCQAVEMLGLLGYPADALVPMMASFARKYGEKEWRYEFWRRIARRASAREHDAA